MKLSRVKGTRDLLPPETERWASVEDTVRRVFGSYGYGEIRTPILEPTELFVRSVGEQTDIVHKEMYTFLDRGDRSVTLRPENTAGVVRALLENHLDQGPMPLRLFYVGPQFRYERPQKGRYREFRQIGAECFGAPGAAADAELLLMLFEFLRALGFRELSADVNAVPARAGREEFARAVREYVRSRSANFGPDDLRRMEENPLRLFDSRDPETAKVLFGSPRAIDFLDAESAAHHGEVLKQLAVLKIPFRENPDLVRGLDYYTKTVFEVTSSDLGAQDAILGGGRYDELVADLGGPSLPAVGFAIGEDRLVGAMPVAEVRAGTRIRVIPFSARETGYALEVAAELRKRHEPVDLDLSGRGLKKGLSVAADLGFTQAAIVGPDEERQKTVMLKDLLSREQTVVAFSDLSGPRGPA
jgi:histidyl-tRNA synthetase